MADAHAPQPRRIRRALTPLGLRFARRADGAAAVEFAIVAVPFFFLIFAILETALVFFAGQILETATADAARLVRTGQAQASGIASADGFRTELCKQIVALIDCSKTIIEVRTQQSFSSIGGSPPVQNGELKATNTYNQSVGGDIVVVRVFYQFPLWLPTFGVSMADLKDGTRLLVGAATFRNEPF